ncbi:M56 family metallopeptidase [Colwellia sp. E2M01]|uniref:M56 family metallopeptidase n=1 Tax=Colwellia sp. E2M01 TaxID=2841561 RepID=UPI001C0A3BAC|nr:M56 family metallopeptidase [Colwellia sp. E2M01]MBU2870138.1 TonB family protein [Colwellia sp. E2M01]
MFELVLNSPFLYSLSLTLVHFLWQGLLVGLILKSALMSIDSNKSKLRYGLATSAMLANLLLAMFTFFMVYPESSTDLNNIIHPLPLTSLVHELTRHNVDFTEQGLVSSIIAYSLPYLSILWLLSIVILAIKLLIEVRNVNSLPCRGAVAPTSDLLARFKELVKQINLPRPPKLLISLHADVPMAIGWLKPVVLLPAGMVTGLNSAQLEMLILHELAHIRRHDYLVNFLQTLVELLFFFHPSVSWVGKQMRNEREYCTDDIAVQHCGDAIAYAHTLTDTASLCSKKHCHTIPSMAMAASGGDLKARVLRLVDHHCAPSNATSKWFVAIVLLLGLTLLGLNQVITTPVSKKLDSVLLWKGNKIHPVDNFSQINYFGSESDFSSVPDSSIAAHLLLTNDKRFKNFPLERTQLKNNSKKERANNTVKLTPLDPFFASKLDDNIASKKAVTEPQLSSTTKNKANDSLKVKSNSKNNDSLATVNKENGNNKKSTSSLLAKHIKVQTEELAPTKSSTTMGIKSEKNSLPPKAVNKLEDTLSSESLVKREAIAVNEKLKVKDKDKTQKPTQVLQVKHTVKDEKKTQTLAKQAEVKIINAKLLDSTSPVYPSAAMRRGIELEVKVNFTIDRNGEVKDISFDERSKLTYFKSAIRSAIRKWRFTPARRDNLIVESQMSKIFSFSLQS